jgi:hypothetical protein
MSKKSGSGMPESWPMNNALVSMMVTQSNPAEEVSEDVEQQIRFMMTLFELDEDEALAIKHVPTLIACLKVCHGPNDLSDYQKIIKNICKDETKFTAAELARIVEEKIYQEHAIATFLHGMEALDPERKGYVSSRDAGTMLEALRKRCRMTDPVSVHELIAPYSVFKYKDCDLREIVREW